MKQELMTAYETEGYVNRSLTQKEIIKMLDTHGIDWEMVVREGDKLYAVDYGIDEHTDTTDTTGWKLFDVLAFLNY